MIYDFQYIANNGSVGYAFINFIDVSTQLSHHVFEYFSLTLY